MLLNGKNVADWKIPLINKCARKIPDDKYIMLTTYKGLIYQKRKSRMDKILTFLFGVDFFHLVWEYPDGEGYHE